MGRAPWREALDVAAQALGAGLGRQRARRFKQIVAARIVEIVRMLVVAEQDRVDRPDCVGPHRGPNRLLQLYVRQLIGARRIEGRSVSRRKPSISISAVGPPIRVMEMGMKTPPMTQASRPAASPDRCRAPLE